MMLLGVAPFVRRPGSKITIIKIRVRCCHRLERAGRGKAIELALDDLTRTHCAWCGVCRMYPAVALAGGYRIRF